LLGLWGKETISNSEGTPFEKKKRLRQLQSRSRRIDATVWVGKDGASEELLKQVVNQLKARELVKVKVHKSALSGTGTSTIGTGVADSTDSTLVEVMGHTFTLYKRKEAQLRVRKK
jgi:putative YhbY family RNA-binding protein